MSVFSYFARNSFIHLGTYAVGVTAAFLVTPHILNSIGASAYGVWALIKPDYLTILMAGCGQAAVALAILFIYVKFIGKLIKADPAGSDGTITQGGY